MVVQHDYSRESFRGSSRFARGGSANWGPQRIHTYALATADGVPAAIRQAINRLPNSFEVMLTSRNRFRSLHRISRLESPR
jgi:hypothetical protein